MTYANVSILFQVTDNPETVWPPEWVGLEAVPEEQVSRAFSLLVGHCRRLALERDQFNQVGISSFLIKKLKM